MSIKSKFFTKWAENCFKNNDTEIALKIVDKAINADSQDLKAYFLKHAILFRTGQLEEALKILDQAIEMNPEDKKDIDEIREALIEEIDYIKTGKNVAVEYYNKGLVFLDQLQQLEESIKMFDKAIEIDPKFAEAYLNKGSALGKLGQLEESIKMSDKALEINPKLVKAYFNKGIVLKILGKYKEALEVFNKADKINSELTE